MHRSETLAELCGIVRSSDDTGANWVKTFIVGAVSVSRGVKPSKVSWVAKMLTEYADVFVDPLPVGLPLNLLEL
jgi:hypothetical protein